MCITLATVPVEPHLVNSNRVLNRQLRDGRARIVQHTTVCLWAKFTQDTYFPQHVECPLGHCRRLTVRCFLAKQSQRRVGWLVAQSGNSADLLDDDCFFNMLNDKSRSRGSCLPYQSVTIDFCRLKYPPAHTRKRVEKSTKATISREGDFVGGVHPADSRRCTESARRSGAPRRGTSAPSGA